MGYVTEELERVPRRGRGAEQNLEDKCGLGLRNSSPRPERSLGKVQLPIERGMPFKRHGWGSDILSSNPASVC